MFQWIKGSANTMVATLSPNYVTLNNSAASHFKDVRWCLVGIDSDTRQVAIKPISKNDIDLHIYPSENLHKISVGTGYARISNKTVMQSLSQLAQYPLTDNMKYSVSYDEAEDMIIIDLNTREV